VSASDAASGVNGASGGVAASLADGAARIPELIDRYDQRVPRYTSYPAAPVWDDEFGEDEFRSELQQVSGSNASIYVHIPFCERLCSFCACNRVITQDHDVAAPYLAAIGREAAMLRDALPHELQSVQFAVGGGSPNFLSPDQLQELAAIVAKNFPPADGSERSIELDPRNTSLEQIRTLAACGFNRISLGVQDMSPKVQKAINRIQSREQIESLVGEARGHGMRSINFDLIYGLPYQTVASFAETLEQVVELRPDRIALYSYAHVTWISKAQRGFERKDLPEPGVKVAIFVSAIARLEAAGYRFLGLDHFALPDDALSRAAERGDLRRNFMGYTERAGLDLLALGATGISELAGAYAQSVREPDAWRGRIESGRLATLRGWRLSDDDRRRKWLIQHLMCNETIDPGAYAERFDEALDMRVPALAQGLEPFERDGLVARDGDVWRVTPLGRIFLRPIAALFDAYRDPGDPKGGEQRFSKAV